MTPGKRLLTAAIDETAVEQPNRIWASIPREDDPAKGFIDITFREYANAVNHAAAWLNATLPDVETFAYEGPNDLRIPILTLAASKVNKRILLEFGLASVTTRLHLIRATKCRALVCDAEIEAQMEELLHHEIDLRFVTVPSAQAWFTADVAEKTEYDSSWDVAKDREWLILHSSGTTGLPKPIVYTNQYMTSIDAAYQAGFESSLSFAANHTTLLATAQTHLSGILSILQMPAFVNAIMVLPQSSQPTTAATVSSVLQHRPGIDGILASPALLRSMIQDPSHLSQLRQLSFVRWAGAPLDAQTADALAGHVTLAPAMGTTEIGMLYVRPCKSPDDWSYYDFAPGQGITFEPHGDEHDGMFELVLNRANDANSHNVLLPWQQIFLFRPHLTTFLTGDLYRPHPTKPGLWKYVGRADDMLVLSNGMNVDAPGVEAVLSKHPDVEAVYVGGAGMPHVYAILELAPSSADAKKGSKFNEKLTEILAKANENLTGQTALREDFVLVVEPGKLPRTAKGQVNRRQTREALKAEIDALSA